MSIDYYGVPRRDELCVKMLVGEPPGIGTPQYDFLALASRIEQLGDFERFARDFDAIAELEGITTEEARRRWGSVELNWDQDAFIQVDVGPRGVLLNHGFGGGELQLEVLTRVLDVLAEAGMYVWDPQRGEWL